MPLPPPAIPLPEATVAGLLAAGGGSEFDSTRATGAARTAGTEPVTSFEEALEAKGLSLKRVDSELHPAAPTAIAASAITRGRDHERNNSTTEDMVCSLARNKQFAELTPRR